MDNCFEGSAFDDNTAKHRASVVPDTVSAAFLRHEYSYMGRRCLSVPSVPLTYYDWSLKNSGIAGSPEKLSVYMNTEAAKHGYYEYYLSEAKLTWEGSWKTGGIDKTDGSFEPIAYRAPFVCSAWDRWNGECWYTTRRGAELLLREHLAGKTGDLLSACSGIPLQRDARAHNKACFPDGYSSYFSYTYTVTENETETVALSVSGYSALIHETTRFCVMLNDRIVWPEGDGVRLDDSSTWVSGFCNIYDMLSSESLVSLEGLRLKVNRGDMIHFVVTDLASNTVKLDPCICLADEAGLSKVKPSDETTAIPAEPGETVDLAHYALRCGDETIPGDRIKWFAACRGLTSSVAASRYVIAPSVPGEYKLAAVYGERRMAVTLAVCQKDGTFSVKTAERASCATVELGEFGKKAMQAGANVPEYWIWALKLAAWRVAKHEKKCGSLASFLFVGDMHWEGNNRNTVKLANYLMAETGVNRLIFAGDLLNGDPCKDRAKQTYVDWLASMQSFGGEWFAVHGNHDNNGAWAPESLDDVLTDDEYYDLVLSHSANARKDGTKKLYNYVDDAQSKIRYYFLSDDAHGFTKDGIDTCTKAGVNTVPYTEQVEWLRETASELSGDWGIIVTEHRMIGGLSKEREPIPSEFYHILTPVLDKIAKERDVIAVFSGHTHWDNDLKTEGGYPVIAISCDGCTTDPDPFLYAGTAGTSDEQRMDLVQIDRQSRKIYMTRIGSGVCREFDY